MCLCAQVCSVLESLEREYKRDEDWCQTDKPGQTPVTNKVAHVGQLLAKHQEQKEAFLKVCDMIQKFSNRLGCKLVFQVS